MWLQFKTNSVKMISLSTHLTKEKKKNHCVPSTKQVFQVPGETAVLEGHTHCFGI